MLKRRELLTGVAASLAAQQLWASEAAAESAAATEALSALSGKEPLIRRAFRPPNYETPLVDLRTPFTRNEAFFVRYHLAVIPEICAQLAARGRRLERTATADAVAGRPQAAF